jgi:hypothetical protein
MEATIRVGRHDVPASASISPKVEVRPSPGSGVGLFATERIAAGEVVLVWGGPSYTDSAAEAARADAEGRGSMRWDDDLFSVGGVDEHPAFGINHSCEPNVWMEDTFRLTAMRDIAPGEELAMDYALLGGDEDYRSEWVCACGAPDCRGTITGRDWRIEALRRRYAGHFLPFVNLRIAEEDA